LPALVALIFALLLPGGATAKKGKQQAKAKDKVVKVMTRNVYLGSSLAGGIEATGIESLTLGARQILQEVSANNFPVRARGLAEEILKKKPDVVGLQEVALWRTGPPSLEVFLNTGAKPTASTVRFDYLKELMARLKVKGKAQYRVAVSQDEFDFEAPADENGVPGDGPNKAIANAEINGRLTMRDVILVRNGAGVTFKRPRGANFVNFQTVSVSGVVLPIARGWTSIDVKVRGSKPFRFVNTHLESFDDPNVVPSLKALQAAELVAKGGPATTKLDVVLVGDINSDDNTVAVPNQQAYRTLLEAGMRSRSTEDPMSCCLKSPLLAVGAGGSEADFDHHIDHILTRDPKVVKLKSSSVSGIKPVRGYWNSDHAGVFSVLKFKR
jgi:endonuclease/exonuclease/phosphatase family metal-dependent hydrolase